MHSRSYQDWTAHFFPLSKLMFILLLTGISCREYQEVQYRGIRNLRVAGVENGALKVVGDAVFYNPNHQEFRLRKGEIEVWLDDRRTATVIPSNQVRILPNSEFMIPLEARVEMKNSGLLGNILGAIYGKTVHLRYEGYIKISSGLIYSKIKLSDEKEVRM